jgi:hypothetical protein
MNQYEGIKVPKPWYIHAMKEARSSTKELGGSVWPYDLDLE